MRDAVTETIGWVTQQFRLPDFGFHNLFAIICLEVLCPNTTCTAMYNISTYISF